MSSMVSRYRDAYRVSTTQVAWGEAIKAVGVLLGALILFGGMTLQDSGLGGGGVVAGAFMGALVGIVFWILGVMVSSQGQILRATLDSAVAVSPFMTDAERAIAMNMTVENTESVAAAAIPDNVEIVGHCHRCGIPLTQATASYFRGEHWCNNHFPS